LSSCSFFHLRARRTSKFHSRERARRVRKKIKLCVNEQRRGETVFFSHAAPRRKARDPSAMQETEARSRVARVHANAGADKLWMVAATHKRRRRTVDAADAAAVASARGAATAGADNDRVAATDNGVTATDADTQADASAAAVACAHDRVRRDRVRAHTDTDPDTAAVAIARANNRIRGCDSNGDRRRGVANADANAGSDETWRGTETAARRARAAGRTTAAVAAATETIAAHFCC